MKGGESLAAIAHDARNVAAALGLCCDLLAEPGVLAEGNQHFAEELQAIASASCALVEKLTIPPLASGMERGFRSIRRVANTFPHSDSIDDLAAAVEQLKGPLAALAGAKIDLQMECLTCFGRVGLSHEDLTRILINLTRNAAEAMPHGGRIRITVQQGDGGSFLDSVHPPETVLLCVQDSGPGIPQGYIDRLFDAGFTTKIHSAGGLHGMQRGLGMHIVRRLVEAVGGRVRVTSAPGGGARFEMELPLIHRERANSGFPADFPERATLKC
ncbi:sensor histidine kinase [Alloacidobacterium dinghuense]|uniref:histidine kinase n=1 Tax=Alloacidobacterium dinghuense TaxID=2763107 RepID=A0A7G8BJY9_9BACT|nr:sensor histidine kinase [Alloacidobacterium dinghuense]QNI32859.1 sensor histidine kinase [Alloacidobacterium dinghuense]